MTQSAPKRGPRSHSRREAIDHCVQAIKLIELGAKTHIVAHVTGLSPDQVRDLQRDLGNVSPTRGAVRSLARIGRTKDRLADMAIYISIYESLAVTQTTQQVDYDAWVGALQLYQYLREKGDMRGTGIDINEAWQIVVGLRRGTSRRDDLLMCRCKICGFNYPDVGVHFHTDCPLCFGRQGKAQSDTLAEHISDHCRHRPLLTLDAAHIGRVQDVSSVATHPISLLEEAG